MPKLNILQICSSLSWGGGEMHVPILANELIKRGHKVIIAGNPNGHILKEAQAKQIPILPINIGGKISSYISPYATLKIAKLIRQENIDIIHIHLSKDLWTVIPAIKLSKKKLSLFMTKHIGSYIIKKDFLHHYLYAQLDKVIAIAMVIHQNLLDTCPLKPEQVQTIHYGLELNKYNLSDEVNLEIRKEFNLSLDTPLVGMVGRISRGKGHKEFLQAAKIILKEIPETHFMIVGDASIGQNEYERKVLQLLKDLDLDENIIFTGFRDDVQHLMKSFDVCVMPSYAEAFGLVALESMACGTPIVATGSDGVLDMIEHNVNGLLFPRQDVKILSEHILTLLKDKQLAIRLVKNAKKRVIEEFDINLMIERIENLYYEKYNKHRY